MMQRLKTWCTAWVLGLTAMSSQAGGGGMVAVVGAGSSADKLTPEQVTAIFLMRMKSIPGAGHAQLIVVQTTKYELYSTLGKTEDQARAIWARQVFTGGGIPPLEVNSVADAKKLLGNPNAVALIDATAVDSSMKVVCNY